jgi:hypothetical protein
VARNPFRDCTKGIVVMNPNYLKEIEAQLKVLVANPASHQKP